VVDGPPFSRRVCQQQPNRFKTSNTCEHIVKVDPLVLDVSLGDKPGLVLNDATGSVMLDLEHPFQANGLLVGGGTPMGRLEPRYHWL
jgi:hypothetical protein